MTGTKRTRVVPRRTRIDVHPKGETVRAVEVPLLVLAQLDGEWLLTTGVHVDLDSGSAGLGQPTVMIRTRQRPQPFVLNPDDLVAIRDPDLPLPGPRRNWTRPAT